MHELFVVHIDAGGALSAVSVGAVTRQLCKLGSHRGVATGELLDRQVVGLVVCMGDNHGATRGGPREQALFHLDAVRFGQVLGQTQPGHYGVG